MPLLCGFLQHLSKHIYDIVKSYIINLAILRCRRMTDISLQQKVEDFVKSRKLLKRDFAAKIGINPIMLSHWLKGRVSLSRRVLEKIIAELDI